MTEDLVVIGGGGLAREAAWIALQQPEQWRLVGFLDDDPHVQGQLRLGYRIMGPVTDFPAYKDSKFIIAVGTPRTRKVIRGKLFNVPDGRFATLIDASAKFHSSVSFAPGSLVCAGAVATVDISCGSHFILNINATVGHDCKFDDYCTVAPLAAISGNVSCAAGVEIGTGAAIRQGIKIGRGAMVGMGSVVVSNVEPLAVVVGNPAKKLRDLGDF